MYTRYVVELDDGDAADRRAPERRVADRERDPRPPRAGATRTRTSWGQGRTNPRRADEEEAHVGALGARGGRTRVPGRRRVEAAAAATLHMIAWEGYTQPQWVKPFEKATGCTVKAKYAGSSDEMVTLMRSGGGGQYDMVSASGDASLRLIYGHDVQPVDPSKIPDFKNFGKAFQSPAEQHGRRQALRHLAAVGAEHAPLQHAEGEARSHARGARSTARSTRARSPSRTTRSRSRTRRST